MRNRFETKIAKHTEKESWQQGQVHSIGISAIIGIVFENFLLQPRRRNNQDLDASQICVRSSLPRIIMTAMIQSDCKMEHVKVKVMAYIRKEKCPYNVSWGWTNGCRKESGMYCPRRTHTIGALYQSSTPRTCSNRVLAGTASTNNTTHNIGCQFI